jgi:hypothetical protein
MSSARMQDMPLPIIPMNNVFFRPSFSIRKFVIKYPGNSIAQTNCDRMKENKEKFKMFYLYGL